MDNGVISQPVVDGEYASAPFLPVDPLEVLDKGDFVTDVEILLGTNSHEGLLITQIITELHTLFFQWVVDNWAIWGPMLLFHKHALEITAVDSAKVQRRSSSINLVFFFTLFATFLLRFCKLLKFYSFFVYCSTLFLLSIDFYLLLFRIKSTFLE